MEGEDQTGLIDTNLPFRDDMAQIQLVLDGEVVAQFLHARSAPPGVTGVKIASLTDQPGLSVTWNPAPATAGKVTFMVQAPGDGNQRMTIAVGLSQPSVTLSADQAKLSTIRVTANNGFRASPPTVIHLCSDFLDRVQKAQKDVDDFWGGP